jgi:NAD(P)-dependent dehydrogenase (short-subunit alcohol dehydrogenase family)
MGALADRVAIITGAAGGIGGGCARRFAEEDAKLVLTDINEHGLEELVTVIEADGHPVVGVRCDIAIVGDIDRVVATAVDRFGRIDILANIAQGGLEEHTRLEDATIETATNAFVTGPLQSMLFMQKCLPYMREQGYGRIINTASHAALLGFPGFASYEMAKGAIMALTRTASQEWGHYGIVTNTILPGARTPAYELSEEAMEALEEYEAKNPLGRVGLPYEDCAPLYLFLASEGACYVNGQAIGVDGGVNLIA